MSNHNIIKTPYTFKPPTSFQYDFDYRLGTDLKSLSNSITSLNAMVEDLYRTVSLLTDLLPPHIYDGVHINDEVAEMFGGMVIKSTGTIFQKTHIRFKEKTDLLLYIGKVELAQASAPSPK